MAGVLLTKRDTFLSRAEFMQLVYSAVCPTRPGLVDSSPINLPPPAILKPESLWTGKQVSYDSQDHLYLSERSSWFSLSDDNSLLGVLPHNLKSATVQLHQMLSKSG